ncbi:DUF3768 domain-containing protein [Bradyrhizobium rifense]|uniref:DUF3768 domain-containing protein n=1 Tax=Bradyrhizobium rifense TaxID=515499 RepID=A0A5D3KUA9_9BRAD|nr:DUF3768 domain-containing protein [Bradyrhizobium rifense]TYL99214.1 DUF3768 domain-containing protein [Bradyrhizobium rifense]
MSMQSDAEKTRVLNDELRKHLLGGGAVITAGIAELGPNVVERLLLTLAVYDDFHHANDPYEQHDFGVFEFEGTRVAFKIDYYDKSLTFHSPNPADPSVTERIITIMRADEY